MCCWCSAIVALWLLPSPAGWFTDPSPFIEEGGGLTAEEVTPVLNDTLGGAIQALQEPVVDGDDECMSLGGHPCTGVLTLRLHVEGSSGGVKSVEFLADTLVSVCACVRACVRACSVAWLGP